MPRTLVSTRRNFTCVYCVTSTNSHFLFIRRKHTLKNGETVYQTLVPGSLEYEPLSDTIEKAEARSLYSPKRPKMDGSFGRPTQVHSVPPEERAVDGKGNKLPWALEWHP